MSQLLWILGLAVPAIYVIGSLSAVDAVLKARSPQGAIAWAVSLVSFPLLAVPLYWIFGARKFNGYVHARRAGDLEINHIARKLGHDMAPFFASPDGITHRFDVMRKLTRIPFIGQNRADLLVDGEATFRSILEGIDGARQYVLLQFFIVCDDELGRELKSHLIKKVREGVRIYFLYDEIGSHSLPAAYLRECRGVGIDIRPFHTTRGRKNRFQLNFRNHRKIVVVDGHVAFVGGLNVGDAYMGRDPKFGPWRDTHCRVEGPAALAVQLSFLEDWYWATKSVPELNWSPRVASGGDKSVLVVPTGPADQFETCSLFFVQAIQSARRRIWVASPYFVPDALVLGALQLAGLRGVDVRVILPQKADHILVYLSAFSYLAEMEKAGVKVYRYQPGFLHQKVMVIDDDVAVVGTANLDNRSFRLNFEIMILFADRSFVREVEQMLERDLENCRLVKPAELEGRPFWFKLAVKFSRLLAPIQ